MTFNPSSQIDPKSRPSSKALVMELEESLHEALRRKETRQFFEAKTGKTTKTAPPLRWAGHKRSFSTEEDANSVEKVPPTSVMVLSHAASGANAANNRPRSSPSEKARFHFRSSHLSAMSVGKEMSLRDPHYRPGCAVGNPFTSLLPKLREGKKIVGGSSRDLFSSCFELPSPARAPTPTALSGGSGLGGSTEQAEALAAALELELSSGASGEDNCLSRCSSQSAPSSPRSESRRTSLAGDDNGRETPVGVALAAMAADAYEQATLKAQSKMRSSLSTSRFEDNLFQGKKAFQSTPRADF